MSHFNNPFLFFDSRDRYGKILRRPPSPGGGEDDVIPGVVAF
jgi:hypothetical protein